MTDLSPPTSAASASAKLPTGHLTAAFLGPNPDVGSGFGQGLEVELNLARLLAVPSKPAEPIDGGLDEADVIEVDEGHMAADPGNLLPVIAGPPASLEGIEAGAPPGPALSTPVTSPESPRTPIPSRSRNTSVTLEPASLPRSIGSQEPVAAANARTEVFAESNFPLPDIMPARATIDLSSLPSPSTSSSSALVTPPPSAATPGERGGSGPALELSAPIRGREWANEFAGRVTWLVSGDERSAELRLNPPELGRIDIRVQLGQRDASLSFSAHNPIVRDAIEQALPRLRDMFAEARLNLGHVDISHASTGDSQHQESDMGDRDDSGLAEPGYDEHPPDNSLVDYVYVMGSDRLIDQYA